MPMLTDPRAFGRSGSSTNGRAPDGAPNVVVILLDDTGFAQLGAFGSDVATPHMDRLAHGGLRYNRFHVTALCSPTRASLLTGRNHHAVGVGFLVDTPMAFPGYSVHLSKSSTPLPRVLKDAGYNTFAVGKWHLVPRGERSAAGPFDRWPSGFGFERYYGFLQGDTNHWAPNLVCDNHYVDAPARPEDGYHLTEDLADQAIRMVLGQKHASQDKPFFLYWALGAMHAPHHVSPEWIAPYEGRFDGGWDRWREETFARQLATGVVPPGTVLTERPPWITAWDEMSDDERRMHARGQEVFAGFLTHTDAQIGRFISFLDELGELDNTIVVLLSDNGASAEGGRFGTINEHRFSARLPETVEDNLAHADDWGGFHSYNHYSWGWAWAGNTPLRLWKRYTWLGGTRTPLIVHWPDGIAATGEVRDQFCHVVDIMPTLLDVCGVERPAVIDGIPQDALDGASLRETFDDPDAPAPRSTQYFEMLGSRSIVHDGWKATTDHVSQGVPDEEALMLGSRDFDEDHWALFHPDDFSEAHDVAAEHPQLVRDLEQLWLAEAGRNDVLPMSEGLTSRLDALLPSPYRSPSRRVFRPGSPISDESLPVLVGGFRIEADVATGDETPGGILCAFGDWNGGFALYVIDGRLTFALRPAGVLLRATGAGIVPTGDHRLGVAVRPGDRGVRIDLFCDGEPTGSLATDVPMPFSWQHGGTQLRIGHDAGLPVVEDYQTPYEWSGTIRSVTVEALAPHAVPSVGELADAMRND
jgi:arylsulfatase